MAGDGEAGEPQPPHDGDDVSRHRALGVRRVVGGRHGTAALAVAAQVRADDGEVASQPRRDLAPHEVRLGESVQQHERRPRSVHPDGELRFAGLDLELLELIHRQLSGHLTALPGSGTPRSRRALPFGFSGVPSTLGPGRFVGYTSSNVFPSYNRPFFITYRTVFVLRIS